MRPFDDGVTAVSVGVRKSAPSRSGRLDDLGADPPERTALVELGAMDLMRRAGAIPEPATPLDACPPETMRVAASAPLEEAMENDALLRQWAEAAAARGFVVPPRFLPAILAKIPRFRTTLTPVLGVRGRWLAALSGVDLKEPPPRERVALGPAYDALDPKERLDAIEALRVGLSAADVPLLMHAMADKRKEVRQAALRLVTRVPESPPSQELRALAQRLVTVRKSFLKTSLEITLPSEAEIPGWLPRSGTRTGIGAGALALLDVLRYLPPSNLPLPPAAMLDLAHKTDYAEVLVEAWGDSALRFGDGLWIDALLVQTHRLPGRSGIFAGRASDGAFDAEILARLRRRETNAAYGLLIQRERPFSPALSRAVVESARRGDGAHYGMATLCARLDPSVLPLLETPWTVSDDWEAVRVNWRTALDLRRRLLESLR